MTAGLEARGITLWRGERRLCHDLDLEVAPGGALQLVGPNGSGKTSLLRALTGLGRLDGGDIRWNGEPIHKLPDYSSRILYLGHHNGLKSLLTPLENLLFYQGIGADSSENVVTSALAQAGLSHVADRPCGLLSMGERRRTALARLLLTKASLWVLDEPLTSVDVEGVSWVNGLLQRHLANGGMVVYATHQPFPDKPDRLQLLDLERSGP